MSNELKEISETLKKIENKIEDKRAPSYIFPWSGLIDFTKMQEESRKKREEERNEEILKIQKIQTESIKNQENFNKIIAFTGGIIALATIYSFLVQSVNLENYPLSYWLITIIFLILIVLCIGPLISFIINFWKKEVLKNETKN